MNNQTTFKIPSKIIISGEHSCVYNQPLIVATLPLYLITQFQYSEAVKTSFNINTTLQLSENELKILHKICEQIINYLKLDETKMNYQFNFQFQSETPIKMGMGSSAQFVLSIFESFLYFAEQQKIQIQKKDNFEFLKHLEDNFHGKSSGLDVLALQQNTGLYYITKQNQEYIINQLNVTTNFKLLLVSSNLEKNTSKAVNRVKEYIQKDPQYKEYINQIGKCTQKISQIISNTENQQEKINTLISENQCLLQKFDISHQKLDLLIKNLRQFGIESKLSGGGLGGFVISIVTNNQYKKIEKNILQFLENNKSIYFIFDIKSNLINRIH